MNAVEGLYVNKRLIDGIVKELLSYRADDETHELLKNMILAVDPDTAWGKITLEVVVRTYGIWLRDARRAVAKAKEHVHEAEIDHCCAIIALKKSGQPTDQAVVTAKNVLKSYDEELDKAVGEYNILIGWQLQDLAEKSVKTQRKS